MPRYMLLLPVLALAVSGCQESDSPFVTLAQSEVEQVAEPVPVVDDDEAARVVSAAAMDMFQNERRFSRAMSGVWQGTMILGGEFYTTEVVLTDAGWSDITAFSSSGANIVTSLTDVVMTSDQSYGGSIEAEGTQLRIYGELGVDRWMATVLPVDVDFTAYTAGTVSLTSQQEQSAGSWELTLVPPNPEAQFSTALLLESVTLANAALSLGGIGDITENNFGFLVGNCQIVGNHAPDPKLSHVRAISVSLTGSDCDFEGSFPGIVRYDADAATVTTLLSDTEFRATAVQDL